MGNDSNKDDGLLPNFLTLVISIGVTIFMGHEIFTKGTDFQMKFSLFLIGMIGIDVYMTYKVLSLLFSPKDAKEIFGVLIMVATFILCAVAIYYLAPAAAVLAVLCLLFGGGTATTVILIVIKH